MQIIQLPTSLDQGSTKVTVYVKNHQVLLIHVFPGAFAVSGMFGRCAPHVPENCLLANIQPQVKSIAQ